ncbi:uracil-DNA glycosylase [Ottowia sp.]|uniref:uracil-DNA glycosylase n=1 Tax=Ottowia sp. TaxID=1898956 RepID=UPI003A8B0557
MTLLLGDRQRAMLAEMGVKVWAPRAPDPTTQSAAKRIADSAQPIGSKVQKQAEDAVTGAAAPSSSAGVTSSEARERPAAKRAASAAPTQPTPAPTIALTPRPEGIEAMDWAQLESAVAACRACGLCDSRTQAVFGAGSRNADWMVVGEAPGENEDRQGQPFVGPAGQLLDAMLAAIGLSRQASQPTEIASESIALSVDQTSDNDHKGTKKQGVYIANVLKCRPPANRNPQPDEVAQCEPYLRRQVALVQPRIILAMGRFAVQSLLNTQEPIGRLRQRVHHYEGVPVIVTYHPAYLLRALPEKAKAWADLCLAMKVARSENV